MSVYHRGKRFFEEVTRQYDPINPYDLSQKRLLQLLDVSPQASLGLLERGEGDIFNLAGTDLEELTDIDGVGPATAARLIAIFGLMAQYESWQTSQAA